MSEKIDIALEVQKEVELELSTKLSTSKPETMANEYVPNVSPKKMAKHRKRLATTYAELEFSTPYLQS